MQGDQLFLHRFLISTGEDEEKGNREMKQEFFHNEFIALGEEFSGHLGAGEGIVAVRVHSGLINDEVRPPFRDEIHGLVQVKPRLRFIAWGHFADAGAGPLERAHGGSANGEVEKIGERFGELGRAVAAVFVAIQNKDVQLGMHGRHECEAVESAESPAISRRRVVETLRHIGGDAVLKGHASGQEVASVDGQHAIPVILAPEAERAFAQRSIA